jgi:hypothetical protein
MEGESLSSPNSRDGVVAELAVSAFEVDFFNLKAHSLDNHVLTTGAERIFCSVPGNIADVDIMEAFAEGHIADFF